MNEIKKDEFPKCFEHKQSLPLEEDYPPERGGYVPSRYFDHEQNFSLEGNDCVGCGEYVKPILMNWGDWTRAYPAKKDGWNNYLGEMDDDDLVVVCPTCHHCFACLSTQCQKCGHRWAIKTDFEWRGFKTICPSCKALPSIFMDGRALPWGQIGGWVGQYKWCQECQELTLNIPYHCDELSTEDWKELLLSQELLLYPEKIDAIEMVGCFTGNRIINLTRKNAGYFFVRCANCNQINPHFEELPLDKCKNLTYEYA